LLTLSIIALVIGLARPRTPQTESKISRDGIAIMMVVDLSSSMDARDLVKNDKSVNRLKVVKDVFTDFVSGSGNSGAGKGRPDDLIGLVTFARYADSICPLTLDHGNLANIVEDLEITMTQDEDGTAVGDGLGLALERLRRSKAKSRIAILLTDGVTNMGVIDPAKAAKLAKQLGIKVYSIGVGTNGMAPMPVRVFGGTRLMAQPVEIDEKTLQLIADETNGKYFRAVDKGALANIYAEIDKLERTKVSELKYLSYTEHFQPFVMSGALMLGLGMILNRSIFRKLP
jgi:Ca-activated chloride channel family protein